MTELILGPAGSGKTTQITERILTDLKNNKHVILLVPEQSAVLAESHISHEAQIRNIPQINLEVLNFKRLCNRVFRQYGGITYHAMTSGTKALLLWQALFRTAPFLTRYHAELEDAQRFVPTLLSAMDECKAYGVTPHDLQRASQECKEDAQNLSEKLSDLSLIFSEYARLMKEDMSDPSDDLTSLCNILKEQPFFHGVSLYVDGFVGFTPQEYEVLSYAFRQADHVTLTLCCDQEVNSMAFENADRERKQLVHLCGKQTPRITYLTETHRFCAAELRYLEKNLWSIGATEAYTNNSSAIRLVYANGLYDEAEFVANDISRQIRNGARYRDFAVIARDIETYGGIIDAVFEKFDLPCHLSRKIPLSDMPLFKLLLSAMYIKIHGWLLEDLISYIKTGITSITPDECDLLESYASTWNITGKRWYSEEDWYMNPDGYTDRLTDEGRNILFSVNDIRRRLVTPLVKFHESLDGDKTVKEICHAAYAFLLDLGIPDYITSTGKDEDILLWNQLCDALDTMVDAIPDSKAGAKLFSGLFTLVVNYASTGTIPSAIDEISIGSADRIRSGNIKHVYLLGVNDKVFPAACEEGGLFSDSEKATLETVGITLSPRSDVATVSELFHFYRAACIPSHSLTILCSTQDLSGAQLKPSLAFLRIQALFPASKLLHTIGCNADWQIQNEKASFERIDSLGGTEEGEALLRYYHDHPFYSHYFLGERQPLSTENEKIDEETANLLFGGDMSLTQSRLDSYVLCAFGYECNYVLKLKENKRADFRASDIGNLIHRILEQFFATLMQGRETLPNIDNAEIDKLLDSILYDYLNSIFGKQTDTALSGRAKQLFLRLRRSVRILIQNLLDEFKQSAFIPRFFEMPIHTGGQDGTVAPLTIPLPDGTNAYIYGVADRVDICRRGKDVYVRVVDYKTGSKDFSLYDISLGLNLQMLLYLFSIWKDQNGAFHRAVQCEGEILPAGVLYCTAKPSEVTVTPDMTDDQVYTMVENTLKRKGLLIDDEEILRLMDEKLSGKYIPVTVKKNGALSTSLTLKSLEEMGKLMNDIMTTVSRLASEMKSGFASCRPLKDAKHDACRFCPHKPICRNSAALS